MQGAVTRRKHLRRYQGEEADNDTAECRTEGQCNGALSRQFLDEGNALHDQDSGAGAESAEQERRNIVRRNDAAEIADVDVEIVAGEKARHEGGDQCGDDDGRQRDDRIGADDELEGVKSAGQRCVEGGGDGAGGAAADERSEIGATKLQFVAEL
jgi:hypothetical protein